METKVKFGAMLNHRFVQGREEHVIFIVKRGHGHDHQTVILTNIAADKRRVAISTGPVRNQQFLVEGILQVGHLCLVEL